MEWNVFWYNINLRQIEVFNIFEHGSFYDDIKRAAQQYENQEEFTKYLKSSLMYYFWSKSEWEIIVCPWCSHIEEDNSKKIDVYEQVVNNWNIFSEYVWNNRKCLKE